MKLAKRSTRRILRIVENSYNENKAEENGVENKQSTG